MTRTRMLEIGATAALLVTLLVGVGGWLRHRQLNEALLHAVWYARYPTVQALLKQGANPNARDEWKQPVLIWTTENPSGATAKVLLRGGASPNAVDRDGLTALMKAARKGYPDLVQILIRYGADVNARNPTGETALMKAARSEQVEITRELLRAGARAELKNQAGETALHLARGAWVRAAGQPYVRDLDGAIRRRRARCREIIRLLAAAGAPG